MVAQENMIRNDAEYQRTLAAIETVAGNFKTEESRLKEVSFNPTQIATTLAPRQSFLRQREEKVRG